MTPFFKTHCSIGKSILTAERAYELAVEAELEEIFFVEDSLLGFLRYMTLSKEHGIPFRMGVRINMCNKADNEEERKGSAHKTVIFALDDKGCKILFDLFSCYSTEHEEMFDYELLKEFWDDDHLFMAVPFYDSFVYSNLHSFSQAMPDLKGIKNIVFCLEDNELPFDEPTRNCVKAYCKQNKYPMMEVKTVYYEGRSDAEAFQVYKGACGRQQFSKNLSLDCPNLEHFGSREFCWESYLDKCQ